MAREGRECSQLPTCGWSKLLWKRRSSACQQSRHLHRGEGRSLVDHKPFFRQAAAIWRGPRSVHCGRHEGCERANLGMATCRAREEDSCRNLTNAHVDILLSKRAKTKHMPSPSGGSLAIEVCVLSALSVTCREDTRFSQSAQRTLHIRWSCVLCHNSQLEDMIYRSIGLGLSRSAKQCDDVLFGIHAQDRSVKSSLPA